MKADAPEETQRDTKTAAPEGKKKRNFSFSALRQLCVSGAIPGQSRDSPGHTVPVSFLSVIQHLGTLTPFGLYKINNGGGRDGMGSGRHLRSALYAISSPKRCSSVWQCKPMDPIQPRRQAPRWRTTGAKPKFKSCVFFFLRGPPASFGRMKLLEAMTIKYHKQHISSLAYES